MDKHNPSAQVHLGKLIFLLSDASFLLASSSLISQLKLSVQCHSSNPNTSVPRCAYVTGAKALLTAHYAFLPSQSTGCSGAWDGLHCSASASVKLKILFIPPQVFQTGYNCFGRAVFLWILQSGFWAVVWICCSFLSPESLAERRKWIGYLSQHHQGLHCALGCCWEMRMEMDWEGSQWRPDAAEMTGPTYPPLGRAFPQLAKSGSVTVASCLE